MITCGEKLKKSQEQVSAANIVKGSFRCLRRVMSGRFFGLRDEYEASENWTVWFADYLVDATSIPESFHVTLFLNVWK